MKKDTDLHIRISTNLKAQIEAILEAQDNDQGISQLVRLLLKTWLRTTKKELSIPEKPTD